MLHAASHETDRTERVAELSVGAEAVARTLRRASISPGVVAALACLLDARTLTLGIWFAAYASVRETFSPLNAAGLDVRRLPSTRSPRNRARASRGQGERKAHVCTYRDFELFGVRRPSIAAAIRLLAEVGSVDIPLPHQTAWGVSSCAPQQRLSLLRAPRCRSSPSFDALSPETGPAASGKLSSGERSGGP